MGLTIKNGVLIGLVFLSACTRIEPPEVDENRYLVINGHRLLLNGDTLAVSEWQWHLAQLGDYPFTTAGDLACSGDSVEFYPDQLHNDDIGLPLNQIARNKYKLANLTPNVPQAIRPNADLKNAIFLGLSLCGFNRNNNPVTETKSE